MVRGGPQDVDVHEDGRPVVVRRAAAADKGDAPTVEVGRAGVDVAGHGFRDAGRDCFILSANDIAETQLFEQFVGGGMSQAEGLMSP